MTLQYEQNLINLSLATSEITADSATTSPLQLPAGNNVVTVDATRTTALDILPPAAASNEGAFVTVSVDAAATGAVTFNTTQSVPAGSSVTFVSDGTSFSTLSEAASLTVTATGTLPLLDAEVVEVDITGANAAIVLTLDASYAGKTLIVTKDAGEDGSTVVFNALAVTLTAGAASDVIVVGSSNLFLALATAGV